MRRHRVGAGGGGSARCQSAGSGRKLLKVAEGTGFEPAKGLEPLNGLANRRRCGENRQNASISAGQTGKLGKRAEVRAGTNPGTGELPYLTSIRGVCALAVLLFHVRWLPMGDRGVDVFFLLSGYVLTWGHMRRPRDAVVFWRARLRRTMPTHLVATTAVGLAMIAYGRGTFAQLAADLGLLPLFALPPAPPINQTTWSLAVEWVAYLAFPAVVGSIVRRPMAVLACAAVALLAAALTLRTGWWVPNLARGLTEFVVGASLAGLGMEPRAHRWLGWIDARPLRWLGEISYPLYLIQALPLLLLIGHPALILTAALGLGAGLHYAVEVPTRFAAP